MRDDPPRPDDLLSLDDVLKELKIGFLTAKRMIARGQLHEVPWGLYPRFRRSEVEKIRRGEIQIFKESS